MPIPKTRPPNKDKLRPVSLTSIFAKVAEGFVSKWILEDVGEKIDVKQFGNVKGVSTSHCLVNLIHFLHQGAEQQHNVGTVVLTDFSKAFDLISHTLLIDKMIDMDDLDSFKCWSDGNSLNLNPALQIKFNKGTPLNVDLKIGDEILPYVDKAKVPGLIIQNDLRWDAQIDDMHSKGNKRLFMLRSLKKFGFDREELIVVYKSYLRPILEYGDVVWHSGINNKQSKTLERIQKRACRTILGHNYSSYSGALSTCNLASLEERRVQHCIKFAQGLNDNVRTDHLLPPKRNECHNFNLRNSNAISLPRFRTSRFYNSPVPYF